MSPLFFRYLGLLRVQEVPGNAEELLLHAGITRGEADIQGVEKKDIRGGDGAGTRKHYLNFPNSCECRHSNNHSKRIINSNYWVRALSMLIFLTIQKDKIKS